MRTTSSTRVQILALSCALVFSSGCATFANGRHQRIQIETNPPGATASVQGSKRQKNASSLRLETPGEVVLHRKEKQVVLRIEKDGYEPFEVALKRGPSAWTPIGGASLLSLGILTGLVEGGAATGLGIGAIYLGISVGIDLATGAAYRLAPSEISVTLQPEGDVQPESVPASGTKPQESTP